MNPQQLKTVKRLGISLGLAAILVVWLFYTEGTAVTQGGHSTISEIMWLAWTNQPGAILVVTDLLAFAIGVLTGHFFWQSSRVYDDLRGKK